MAAVRIPATSHQFIGLAASGSTSAVISPISTLSEAVDGLLATVAVGDGGEGDEADSSIVVANIILDAPDLAVAIVIV